MFWAPSTWTSCSLAGEPLWKGDMGLGSGMEGVLFRVGTGLPPDVFPSFSLADSSMLGGFLAPITTLNQFISKSDFTADFPKVWRNETRVFENFKNKK